MEAVRTLDGEPVDVLLIDRNNYHAFQPLLYQVATAGLMPGHVTQPARHIFHDQKNLDFRMGEVVDVDFDAREVFLADGERIGYDALILAAGAAVATFGVEGVREHAYTLKSVADALSLRHRLVGCFETVDRAPHLANEGWLNFVLVGGGPTGVELAGAMAELFETVFREDFRHVDVRRSRIVLVEQADGLLPGYPRALQDYTKRELERRGVVVRLGTTVERVTPEAVYFASGERLSTQLCVWAAGVRAVPLADQLGMEQGLGGRLIVEPTLQVPGHAEAFVAGDLAAVRDALYPQVAQVAIQQGRLAAQNVLAALSGRPAETFTYTDLGMMATIGRHSAVVVFPSGRTLRGRPAWLAWLGVHLVKLVGFRNRTGVFLNWLYNYFSWDRGPRLMLPGDPAREVDG